MGALRVTLVAATVALAVVFTSAPLHKAAAAPPNAYVTTKVNQRAGPGTDYPVVTQVPARSYVTVFGCIKNYGWCDIGYRRTRGWILSRYLRGYTAGRYMPVREFARRVRLPAVVFSIDTYWPKYYRKRSFYSQYVSRRTPRRPAIKVEAFYRPLSSHGSWIFLRERYVWVPDGVEEEWRPYTEGHWTYTRRYGWMWVSDEPFGWATYHYGRWGFSKRIGWFWIPDTHWAPAWVAWRQSDDHLGWAPLPPDRDDHSISIEISIGDVPDYYWQVVPSSAFLSTDISREVIRDDRRRAPLLRETRPLGNVTIINNVVVNNVVNIQYIEQKTKEKIVVHEVVATSDAAQASKTENGTVQVLTAAAVSLDQPATQDVPPEVKKVEEVAAKSLTKEQAGSEPETEQLVAPPSPIPSGTSDDASAAGDAALAPAESEPSLPESQTDQQTDAPSQSSDEQATQPAEEAPAAEPVDEEPAPPPASDEQATQPAEEAPAAEPVDEEPAPPPASDEQATQPAEEAPAAEPVDEEPAPPPASDEQATQPAEEAPAAEPVDEEPAPPPASDEQATQPAEEAPAAEPVDEEAAPPPASDEQATQPAEEAPAAEPVDEEAAPPPASDEQATQPAEEAPAAEPVDEEAAPPPATDEEATQPAKKRQRKVKCPEGTVKSEDGSCVPAGQ